MVLPGRAIIHKLRGVSTELEASWGITMIRNVSRAVFPQMQHVALLKHLAKSQGDDNGPLINSGQRRSGASGTDAGFTVNQCRWWNQ